MSMLGNLLRGVSIALLVAGSGFIAGAADLYWDANGGTAGTGGTGNWNLSDQFWRLGSDTGTLQSWPGSASDVAFFGGSAGTVTVSSAGVQAGGFDFSTTGYTIDASGGNSLTLVGPATVTTGSGVAATMNASLGGSAGLTKAGAGSFTVAAGSAAYSGTTTVSAGTLQLNYAGLSVPAAGSTTKEIASDATLAYFLASGTGYENVTTNISGSGTLRFDQAGELDFNLGGLRLAGTNSFNGTIEIGENAALVANSAGALQGKPAVVFTGSVGRLGIADTASGSVIRSLSGAAGSIDGSSGTINTARSLTIEQNSTSSFGGTIVDGSQGRPIAVTKSGTGTLTLSGNNSYTGGTTVTAGRLVGTTSSLQGAITNNAAVTFDQATSGTYSGAMTGSGILTKLGNGIVTLSGNNTYSGGTIVTAGTLVGTTSSLRGAITNNAAVRFDQATNGTYSGEMTGSGSLTKLGTGTVTLSGNNTYSGGTIVTAGTLVGTTSSLQGGITNNAAVRFDQATNGTYSGAISGSGSLTKLGDGTVTLSGNNTYSGATTVSAGTLQLNYAGGSVPAAAASIASGATLAYFLASGSGFQNIAAGISGSGTLRFAQAGGLTFNLGGLRLAGTNSFSGTIEIGENAALVANSANALQGKPAVVFTGSVGRLGIADTASGSVIRSLSGAAGLIDGGSGTQNTPRSLTIEQNSTTSFGGTIVDDSGSLGRTIAITKSGTGTLTLTGNNSYSGGTTISGGRLEIAPAGQLAAGGAITINGATADLRYNSSTSLTAPLTFTQGTISGTGTIGTAVTVAAGRILAPGNSPGAQAYTGGLTWSPGGSYQWEINDANGVVGTNWDVLNVSGGALNLTGLSSESRFNLDLITLSGTASGLMANYIDGQSYSFAIATYSSLALPTGFTDTDLTSLFQLNTSGWLNPLPAPGNFMVINDADANTINLVIVPEPAGLALAGLGSVAAAWALRRRKILGLAA